MTGRPNTQSLALPPELEAELAASKSPVRAERRDLSPHDGSAALSANGNGDSLPSGRSLHQSLKFSLDGAPAGVKLKHMLNQNPAPLPPAALDALFHALADPARRGMVDRLSRGPASVSQLAAPFAMTLPAVVQHLAVLEKSGLVKSQKVGRVRTCTLDTSVLTQAEVWINQRRTFWENSFDRLGAYLAETKPEDEQ